MNGEVEVRSERRKEKRKLGKRYSVVEILLNTIKDGMGEKGR